MDTSTEILSMAARAHLLLLRVYRTPPPHAFERININLESAMALLSAPEALFRHVILPT
jgi:hypothetical protein